MHQKLKRNSLLIMASTVILLLFSVAGLYAQLATGKVEGTVRDKDTGVPLQGAQVTIEGTRLGNVTNADGYYFILNVPPGQRNITFTYTGYQKTTVSNPLSLAGQTITVDAHLSSTVVQLEGITVEGEAEILRPRDETTTKRRMTAEEINETPAQRLEDLMILEAGVEIGGRGSRDRGLRIRGGRIGEEAMIVDGVMVRNYSADPFATGNGWVFENDFGSRSDDTTPLEVGTSAVEQVDIITGGFQAEYGNAQSGIINIVTKEGGSSMSGNIRYTTDQINPRTADWGYNQLMTSLGGPVSVIPNMYFHLSGEIQGQADRTPTHASDGFRGIDQTFVDRLNEAVRNDPAVKAVRTENPGVEYPFTLEKLQTGHTFYVNSLIQDHPQLYNSASAVHQGSLFTPDNPVRLPNNWGDRTLLTGKITYSPTKDLKFLLSENWSRNQHSYPSGYAGEGDYFQTGLFYKGDPLWEGRDWGDDDVVYVPQAYARRTKTHNLLTGFDWNIFSSATRNAALQFRFSYFGSVGINQGSIETDYERDTFMSWSPHDVRFEIERYYNREGPHPSRGEKWVDGDVGWKQGVDYESPFEMGQYTAYYMHYGYKRERQRNYKADLDFQLDRYNRAKLGFQFTHFNIFDFSTDYKAIPINPLDTYPKNPEIWSAYIQNRTDVGDLVVNYGLRYDGYAPKTNWGTTSYDPYAEFVRPNVQTSLSPRFDVAFPVTDATQFRFSYGVFTQLPSLEYMLRISSGGANQYNLGDLGYARTDAFEAGMSYLLGDDMVLDLVAYYRDIDGNLATKEFFRDYYLWYTEKHVREWYLGSVNRDNGNIKGLDLQLRRRFSNNFSFNMMYTLQFSRTTGSAPNTPSLEGNLDPATGEQYVPPDELRPIDNDRTHKLSCQFNYLFPKDFKSGTLVNKILNNFRTYAVFTLLSGDPLLDIGSSRWTQFDNLSLTRDAAGRRVGGLNFFRGAWSYDLSLRFSKQFSLGARRQLNVFTEIFNALNYRRNRPYPSGYTLEPYTHVTGGVDLVWEDISSDNANLPRFNADFDGNGILTVEEAALGAIAQSVMDDMMDKRMWGQARQIRTGLEITF